MHQTIQNSIVKIIPSAFAVQFKMSNVHVAHFKCMFSQSH